jgi:serine/threonine-protein phosphatase PGAM5
VPSDDAATFANCTAEELASGAAQCSKAFSRYFTRPRRKERREVLVCHGNIIRYFICRALGIPPETWGRLNSHNCSISAVAIYPDGFMMVESYNDVGHLPERLLTRT